MASERLQVILDMETGAYRREAKKASDSTKEIGTSAQQTGTHTDTMGSKLQAARGKMVAFGSAGAAVVVGVSKVIEAIRDMNIEAEAIENRFEQVFGEGASDVRAWSDEVNERFGISERAVRDLANGIADLLVPLGFTRTEAAGLTEEALTLANALSEWSGGAIDVADASERIRKALLGERESLEALGVKVLQSDVNARLLAEGQQNLTGAEKARAEALTTLNIIQDKSTDAIVAYEEGTNKALIAQKALNAEEEDRKNKLAGALAPEVEFITELYTAQNDALAELIEQLQETGDAEGDTADETKSLSERLLDLAASSDVADTAEVNFVENLAKGIQFIIEWRRETEGAGDAAEEAAHQIQGSGSSAGEAAAPMDILARTTHELWTGMDGAATATEREVAALGELSGLLRAQTSPVFAAVQSWQNYQQTLAKVDEDGQRTAAEIIELSEAAIDTALAFGEFDPDEFEDVMQAIADSTGEPMDRIREVFDELEFMTGRQWSVDILYNVGTRRDVASTREQVLDDLLSGGASTGSGPQARAHGGPVSPSEPYLVGERGPEIIIPTASGTVIPNNQLMGSTVVSYYTTVAIDGATYGGDPAQFAKGIAREMDRALVDLRGGRV